MMHLKSMDKSVKRIYLFLFFLIPNCLFSMPIILDPAQNLYHITDDYGEIYFDTRNEQDLTKLSNKRFNPNFIVLNKLNQKKIYDLPFWLRFVTINPTDKEINLILTAKTSKTSITPIYVYSKKENHWKVVEQQNFTRKSIFILNIPAHQLKTFYINHYNKNSSTLFNEFYLQNPIDFFISVFDNYFILDLTLGISMALLLYSFFMFMLSQRKRYLIYFSLIFCSGLSIYSYFGYFIRFNHLWTNHFSHLIYRASLIACGFFILILTQLILRTKILKPLSHKIINLFLGISLPFCCISFMPYDHHHPELLNIMIDYFPNLYLLMTMGIAMIIAVKMSKQQSIAAKFHLTGICWCLINYLIFIISYLDFFKNMHTVQQIPILLIELGMIFYAIALSAHFFEKIGDQETIYWWLNFKNKT